VSEVIWQEPEANRKGRVKASRLAVLELELRKNPNRWALFSERDKQSTANPRFRGAEFERAYRIVTIGGTKKYRIYIRYIGG
jgi:hypothetical protein